MSNVSDAVKKLVLRGNITLTEFGMFTPTEEEFCELFPQLDNEALIALWPMYMRNASENFTSRQIYVMTNTIMERFQKYLSISEELAESNTNLTQKLSQGCDNCIVKI